MIKVLKGSGEGLICHALEFNLITLNKVSQDKFEEFILYTI